MGSWFGVLGLGLCFQYNEEIKANAEIRVNLFKSLPACLQQQSGRRVIPVCRQAGAF